MLKVLRCVHAVFFLLEGEIGELGYGANRVAKNVTRIVQSYESTNPDFTHLDPLQPLRVGYCTCENGLTSPGCPCHDENGELLASDWKNRAESHLDELKKRGNGVDY